MRIFERNIRKNIANFQSNQLQNTSKLCFTYIQQGRCEKKKSGDIFAYTAVKKKKKKSKNEKVTQNNKFNVAIRVDT